MRTQPRAFAALLEERAKSYEGSVLRLKRGDTLYKSQTHEGARACLDAKQYLEGTKPLSGLEFAAGLSEAGRDIVAFIGPDGEGSRLLVLVPCCGR